MVGRCLIIIGFKVYDLRNDKQQFESKIIRLAYGYVGAVRTLLLSGLYENIFRLALVVWRCINFELR